MHRRDDTIDLSYEEAYHFFKAYEKQEAMEIIYASGGRFDVDEDAYDLTMQNLSRIWGFDYERRLK